MKDQDGDSDKVVMKNKGGEEVVRQACGTRLNGIGWLHVMVGDEPLDLYASEQWRRIYHV